MELSSFFPPTDVVVFDPCQRRAMTAASTAAAAAAAASAAAVSETIPMSDIVPRSRSDALSRVHAQSSAETSGLGDSLQRIHALSSTETGFPSPTGGGQVSAYASMEDVPAGAAAAMRSPPPPPHPPPVWVVEKERTGRVGRSYDDPTVGGGGGGGRGRPGGRDRDASPPGHVTEEHYEDCYDDRKWQQIHERALLQSASSAFQSDNSRRSKDAEKDPQRFEKRGSTESGEMAATSPAGNQQGTTTEAGPGAGGHFLGKSTQSAWLRWSHERRASFKRKVEFIEQRQNELQRIRTSSPVRKARKESMRFVSPELEDQHMSFNDDVTLAHPAFPFEIPPIAGAAAAKKPSRKNTEEKDETRLTLAQWNALVAFWEHEVFVRSRCFGFLLGLVAFCLIISGLATSHWFNIDDHSYFGACHVGLWQICSSVYDNCTFIEYDKWQIAVIGMSMFSATFNFMALALSVFGICSSSLPKKIYYYHSAGEIHLLCAIGCSVTLILFPLTVESETASSSSSLSSSSSSSSSSSLYSFGYSYFVVWVATGCLCVAAFSMCLDDLVRTVARGLCNRSNSSKV